MVAATPADGPRTDRRALIGHTEEEPVERGEGAETVVGPVGRRCGAHPHEIAEHPHGERVATIGEAALKDTVSIEETLSELRDIGVVFRDIHLHFFRAPTQAVYLHRTAKMSFNLIHTVIAVTAGEFAGRCESAPLTLGECCGGEAHGIGALLAAEPHIAPLAGEPAVGEIAFDMECAGDASVGLILAEGIDPLVPGQIDDAAEDTEWCLLFAAGVDDFAGEITLVGLLEPDAHHDFRLLELRRKGMACDGAALRHCRQCQQESRCDNQKGCQFSFFHSHRFVCVLLPHGTMASFMQK